ncbi:hypothetical protein Bca101_030925 [Brassica carinata]
MLSASIGELMRDLILGVIKSDLQIVWANSWRQPRGLFKSMDPNSEVKKRERLTKCILKLKDNKLAEVRIEASGSRKPRMLRKRNRVGQVVRGLRWNLNELAKAIDGLLRDNLKESGNRETELDKSSMEEPKD